MLAIDVHQHLWPEGLLLGLAQRTTPPCARWSRGRWTIELPGEPSFTVDPAEHDPATRAEAVRAAGLDRALVALSSPIGIEALPAGEAEPLLAAYHDEALALPDALQTWAAPALDAPDPAAVDALLDRGAVGLCLPAGALASPEGLDRVGPLLAVLQDRMAPLFVHPGPAPWQPAPATSAAPWWAPATRYVADVHAAWHVFHAWGRPALPRLRVVFALLAGLAPLHAERVRGRGGPAGEPDPLVFYDTSSYGPRALRAVAAEVGTGQLVHGTDVPVLAAPTSRPLGHEAHELMRTDNAARLLGHVWVAA
jgi:hypothetical protein